mmetsp:Transcript_149/g.292  ORF Transcript_149/g.292 Transcript_149/m.292 type:complete len:243 (-) Transcript_149:12-740(-)
MVDEVDVSLEASQEALVTQLRPSVLQRVGDAVQPRPVLLTEPRQTCVGAVLVRDQRAEGAELGGTCRQSSSQPDEALLLSRGELAVLADPHQGAISDSVRKDGVAVVPVHPRIKRARRPAIHVERPSRVGRLAKRAWCPSHLRAELARRRRFDTWGPRSAGLDGGARHFAIARGSHHGDEGEGIRREVSRGLQRQVTWRPLRWRIAPLAHPARARPHWPRRHLTRHGRRSARPPSRSATWAP